MMKRQQLRTSLRRKSLEDAIRNGPANCAVVFSLLAILTASTALWSTSRLLELASRSSKESLKKQASASGTSTSNVERAVFYNVYIEPDERQQIATRKGHKIVQEQLIQLQRSQHLKEYTIYYNLIGKNVTGFVQENCKNQGLKCQQMHYLESSDEGSTLDALFDYCLEHPDSIVTYLHDKGSYHPKPENDKMRFMTTKAAVSDECQTMNHDMCNVCSARFSFLPHMHFPGNMWTTHCSYVKDLIRPSEFPERMQEMVDGVLRQKLFGMEVNNVNKKQHMVGIGRFAFEHWISSHPDVKPCDVYDGRYRRSYAALPKWNEPWKPHLQQAGWIPLQSWPRFDAKGEWFCGKGRIYEFLHLYGKTPSADSFFYDHYAKPHFDCEPVTRPTRSMKISVHYADDTKNNWGLSHI